MSLAKAKLKAAREAIGNKDFEKARIAASSVLDYEPDNYNGHVFLALALSELGQHDESEQSYRNAIGLNKSQLLAWQGLSKLYEKNKKWSEYADTLLELMNLFSASDDAIKCAETFQRLLELRRQGSSTEIINTLDLVLPGSRYYSTLSQLPPPDHTNPSATTTLYTQDAIYDSLPIILEIVDLTEQTEQGYLKKEVEKRRTRLGAAPVSQLKKDVGIEVWSTSRLPNLYNDILNHPSTSDELRRETDSKLLRYKQQFLFALPESDAKKNILASEVQSLASDAVLLRLPDELAWMFILDNKDTSSIEQFDMTFLRQFATTFPSRPIAQLIQGYFAYSGIPFSEDEEVAKDQREIPPDEAYDMILIALEKLPNSTFAHWIVSQVYLTDLDYSSAINVAQHGLELLLISEKEWGSKRDGTRRGLKMILATCFVHFYPPKHHAKALSLLDEILAQDPDNIPSLMGRGYILQAREEWEQAASLFDKVVQLTDEENLEGLRAGEESSWSQSRLDKEMGIESLKHILTRWEDWGDRDEDCARCLWRIGNCYLDLPEQREKCYPFFIQTLKKVSAYAPAFSSLGIYYSEVASPSDLTRSSKCFQKAFELDAREVEAARRLAEGFANEREWDLVEVVARRTIEGEGGLDAGLEQSKGNRFVSANAWAWKAVGIVQLIQRNYLPAIQSLQVAIRSTPDDALLWLRLGEAYSSAGRQIAAIKALDKAKELGMNDWMCTYFLGDLQRQIGQYSEAIQTFQIILSERPGELGVLFNLSQTYIDQGYHEAKTGFIARAELSFTDAIQISLQIVDQHAGFRSLAWKTIGDSLYALSNRTSFLQQEVVSTCIRRVLTLTSSTIDAANETVSAASWMEKDVLGGLQALGASIIAYNVRKSLNSAQKDTKGGPEYDLGISLRAWAARGSMDSSASQNIRQKGAQYIVEALQQDPLNDLYWSSLGTAKFLDHPKTAQHAYLKALELDSKNVSTWMSLGYLYLYHSDIDLAAEAFLRAQTLDPDASGPWVGQSLIASYRGKHSESGSLLLQATSLNANMPDADLEYASHFFSAYVSKPPNEMNRTELLPTFFLLSRYCKQRPDDGSGLHLFALVCESLGQLDCAEEYASKAISILESSYEETEDPVIEKQFIIATGNLARLKLSTKDYEGALEAFESVLGLLGDEELDESQVVLKTQAQFLSGISHFRMGNFVDSVECLGAAIATAAPRQDIVRQIVVVLSQVLWAEGTPQGREAAKNRLLECISEDPQNLSAITALVAMGILTEDETLLDAGLSEILSLPIEERVALDPQGDVQYLLIRHHIGMGDIPKAVSLAQSSVLYEPSDMGARAELATLMIQGEECEAADALLSSSPKILVGDATRVSHGHILTSIAQKMVDPTSREPLIISQRALKLTPSDPNGWVALGLAKQ